MRPEYKALHTCQAFTFSMRSAGRKLITLSGRGGCGKLRVGAAAADIALGEPSPFADLPSPAIARMPSPIQPSQMRDSDHTSRVS